MRTPDRRGVVTGAGIVAVASLLYGCAWMDADRGRNPDHEPPAGEETWDPEIEDQEIDDGIDQP